jgi:hypothetical protein
MEGQETRDALGKEHLSTDPPIAVPRPRTWQDFSSVAAVLFFIVAAMNVWVTLDSRLDRIESVNQQQDTEISRHDATLQQLAQVDARLARIEARLDMIMQERGPGNRFTIPGKNR